MKVSVIILCYNSNYERVVMSIDSCLQQSYKDYELIISDDGSSESCMPQIERYLAEQDVPAYHVLTRETNGGTVRNCVSAMEQALGRWVLFLGAGDMMYDNMALQEMVSFLERRKCPFAFGNIQRFHMENGRMMDDGIRKTPRLSLFYRDYLNGIRRLIVKMSIVLRYDAIPALAMFGSRNAFLEEIRQLEGRVTYCEDLFQIGVYLQGKRFHYLDRAVKRYELGVGISSLNDVRFNRLLEQDVQNMYVRYQELYPDSWSSRVLLYACVKSPYLKKVMESILNVVYKHGNK